LSNNYQIGYKVHLTPKPSEDTTVQLILDSNELAQYGMNIHAVVTTPAILCEPPFSMEKKAITVIAHLDTGASITSIDERIAQYLGLISIGKSSSQTANGIVQTNNYFADIIFSSSQQMRPFQNVPISSCYLPYKMNINDIDYLSKTNIGLLIGRDIMSHWNIVWHGPTSIVFISD